MTQPALRKKNSMKKQPPVPSRDDATLVERVRSLRAHGWNAREAGAVREMPSLTVKRSPGGAHPPVLLVGGIHGDEPAGVEAAVRWMESGLADRWGTTPGLNFVYGFTRIAGRLSGPTANGRNRLR